MAGVGVEAEVAEDDSAAVADVDDKAVGVPEDEEGVEAETEVETTEPEVVKPEVTEEVECDGEEPEVDTVVVT